MITSKQILTLLEDYYGRIKSDPRFPIRASISSEVFINPTQKELREIGDTIRFLADANQERVYVWDSDILHRQAEMGLFGHQATKPGILLGVAKRNGSKYEMTGSDQLIYQRKITTIFEYDWTWADRYIVITPRLDRYRQENLS